MRKAVFSIGNFEEEYLLNANSGRQDLLLVSTKFFLNLLHSYQMTTKPSAYLLGTSLLTVFKILHKCGFNSLPCPPLDTIMLIRKNSKNST